MAIHETQWARTAQLVANYAPQVGVGAMRHFFHNFDIAGRPADEVNTIAQFLSLGMTNGLRADAVRFGNQYVQERDQATLEQIRDSIVASGYANFPTDFETYVNANPNMLYADLQTAAQGGDVDAQRALSAFEIAEQHKLEGELVNIIRRENRDAALNQIY